MALKSEDKQSILERVAQKLHEKYRAAKIVGQRLHMDLAKTERRATTEGEYVARTGEDQYQGLHRRVDDLDAAQMILKGYRFPENSGTVDVGSLVRVQEGKNIQYLILLPAGGGTDVTVKGIAVKAITPYAPLARQLYGKARDDKVLNGNGKTYTIKQVY
jgi:transcription elongation GreA/GreB family factor